LHNSQGITAEFLKEVSYFPINFSIISLNNYKTNLEFLFKVESNILVFESENSWIIRCFGMTKDPET
jgi:hypothetical protein